MWRLRVHLRKVRNVSADPSTVPAQRRISLLLRRTLETLIDHKNERARRKSRVLFSPKSTIVLRRPIVVLHSRLRVLGACVRSSCRTYRHHLAWIVSECDSVMSRWHLAAGRAVRWALRKSKQRTPSAKAEIPRVEDPDWFVNAQTVTLPLTECDHVA